MLASASEVLNTRDEPNFLWRLCVTLKTPPFPLTAGRLSSRLQSATSSPKTTTASLRAISSCRQALRRSTIVFGSPTGRGSVLNASEVGSTSGE